MKKLSGLFVTAILWVLMCASSRGGVIDEGLVAYWSFDDCSVKDDSGNGHAGSIIGDPGCFEGIGGKAFQFDGVVDLIEIPDSPDFHFVNEMTVVAWVKPAAISGLRTILGKWYTPDAYFLGIVDESYNFTVAFPGGSFGQIHVVTAPATTGVWTHVAGVFDGANVSLYLNGAFAASTPAVGTLQDSSRPLAIGNHPPWNAFEGAIDEVALYNRALSATEILNLFGVTTVTIDIWPRCFHNLVHPGRGGVIPVGNGVRLARLR